VTRRRRPSTGRSTSGGVGHLYPFQLRIGLRDTDSSRRLYAALGCAGGGWRRSPSLRLQRSYGRMPVDDEPRVHGMLDVGHGQQIYWEEWGSPDGFPALYVHGGPGGGLRTSVYPNRFDLTGTRLIGFEQRGCGRSTPRASDVSTSLSTNTRSHLIADVEQLREHLGLDAWLVNGVSWGATLALAYAQAPHEHVLGIVLFTVTTTSRSEVDWITEGVGAVFPEAWDRFAGHAERSGVGYER
jgi:proline iminopeptidase